MTYPRGNPLFDWTARDFRFFVLAELADGQERTTTEITNGYSPISESVYRAVKNLSAHGLVRVRKDIDGRLRLAIVYSPELLTLDVLNTVPDDGGVA